MITRFSRNFLLILTVLFVGCASATQEITQRLDVATISCPSQTSLKPILYFGHPVASYNSRKEKELIDKITVEFHDWYIENPNQPQHEAGYRAWREKTGNGMEYYFQVVFPTLQGGIFAPYSDGKWGAGVYGEALKIFERNCPIWEISYGGKITTTTPEKMRLTGGVLSIQDTRERNKIPY